MRRSLKEYIGGIRNSNFKGVGSMKIRVIDCDAIVGFVDYGTIDSEKNGGWSTKMRCRKCGAAWLAENHASGIDSCPKCGATGKKYVIPVE